MREDEDRAETELEERRQEIAEPRADECSPAAAREARVVGDERNPRHGERDHEIDREPERAAVAAGVPELADVAVLDDPDGEIHDRGGDGPDADLADIASDEADGPQEREHEPERAE